MPEPGQQHGKRRSKQYSQTAICQKKKNQATPGLDQEKTE
jgi:hypothetical protein